MKSATIVITPSPENLGVPCVLRKKRGPYKTVRYSATPEYGAVNTHRQSIKTAYKVKNATYRNLPFFAGWDPDQGGCMIVGAQWIIKNLGHKPDQDHELHIIDRRLGFVPGNLAWVPRSEHKREEMLTKLLIENQKLKNRLKALDKFSSSC
jgi:hypothetical protein